MVSLNAFADFDRSTKYQNGDLYYYLDEENHQAEVTSKPSGKYTGSITIPSKISNYSVTSIGYDAFRDCSGLTSVTIGNSVTSIGSSAFSGCSGLTSVTIPNSVTSIGSSAFYECSGLTSIKVDDGNTKYDSRDNCNAIIETASNTLVRGCRNTIIPNSVTSIGNNAFYGCSGLTSVTIPNSVKSIGSSAFYECSGLTSVTIPNSVTSIGNYAFRDCSGLTSITIGNSVTSIGYSAFSGCSSLTSIIIPNSVTSIEDWAFSGCLSLKRIIIGEGLSTLGGYVFRGSDKLEDIYCFSVHCPKNTSNGALNNVDVDYVWLHVPEISVKAYQGHEVWGKIKMIVPITAEEMETLDVKGVTIKHHDDASAIYNLNGQRLNEAKNGLNIINGRKVVIK